MLFLFYLRRVSIHNHHRLDSIHVDVIMTARVKWEVSSRPHSPSSDVHAMALKPKQFSSSLFLLCIP